MKPEVIRETVMRFAADEWRAINHAMCKPWQNAAGVALAPLTPFLLAYIFWTDGDEDEP